MFTNCSFMSNSCEGDICGGGALAMQTGQIIGGTFQFNSAHEGGALWTSGSVTAEACFFSENTATYGGAVKSTGPIWIRNTVFSNCFASGNGMAMYSAGGSDISDGDVRDFASFSSDTSITAFYHEATSRSTLFVMRRVVFHNVELLFVASSEPSTVVIVNLDFSASDVSLESLLTCADSEMGTICPNAYCSDVAAGIEVLFCDYGIFLMLAS